MASSIRQENANLQCHFCKNYLSVKPAVAISKGRHKCGRCSELGISDGRKHVDFENWTESHVPCFFKDCKEICCMGEIEQHQKNCKHKTILRRIMLNCCEEDVDVTRLCNHFLKKHPHLLYYDKVTYTRTKYTGNVVFLLIKNKYQYLAYVHETSNITYVSVFSVNGPCSDFDVKLTTLDSGYICSLFKYGKVGRTIHNCPNKVDLYDDEKNKQISEAVAVKISKEEIRDLLKYDIVECTINIREKA